MAAPDAKSGAPDPNPVYDFTRARDTAVGEKFTYVNFAEFVGQVEAPGWRHAVGPFDLVAKIRAI